MEDRQPTRPGRVAITDELTGETRYATIEMADDPTKDGTQPIKPNLFDDTTQARYPAGVDTVNLALRETVLLKDKATAAEAAAGTDDTKWMTPSKIGKWWSVNGLKSLTDVGGTRISAGRYVGTGTNSWTITVGFKPKVLFLYTEDASNYTNYYLYLAAEGLYHFTPACAYNYDTPNFSMTSTGVKIDSMGTSGPFFSSGGNNLGNVYRWFAFG